MKKWEVRLKLDGSDLSGEELIAQLLKNRGIVGKKNIASFLHPKEPQALTAADVDIEEKDLIKAIGRIQKAIQDKESIVVYADYDADGITAGAVMWEALYSLGANAKPYIPHRVDEGYGLSIKGINAVREQYNPTLIITVDHGITAWEKVEYAKSLGIDVVVTDHHVKPDKLPDCTIIHTTKLSGAGVSWFLVKELLSTFHFPLSTFHLLELASIGTIADLVPLVGPNRSIVKYGLEAINSTKRVGLLAIMKEAGLTAGSLATYDVSHVLAPRLNAMGRIVHAMDALRLICTKQEERAASLAQTLGFTNKERQQLTIDTVLRAREFLPKNLKKLIFLSHQSYNQGVIGLVAGKLVEEFYRPAVVVSEGPEVSKASARSIPGFNIVEAIRTCGDILIDVGGHPAAAGFTIETKNLGALKERLEKLAEDEITEEQLKRELTIDAEIPLSIISEDLWRSLRAFEPFGFGNPEPVFVSRVVEIVDARLVGADGRHLKLKLTADSRQLSALDAIAFGFGSLFGALQPPATADLAYTIDMNVWNGNRSLQLKVKDIQVN